MGVVRGMWFPQSVSKVWEFFWGVANIDQTYTPSKIILLFVRQRCPTHCQIVRQRCPAYCPIVRQRCSTHCPIVRQRFSTNCPIVRQRCPSYCPIVRQRCPTHCPIVRQRFSTNCPIVQNHVWVSIKDKFTSKIVEVPLCSTKILDIFHDRSTQLQLAKVPTRLIKLSN